MRRMAIETREVAAGTQEASAPIGRREHEITRAWVCPLIKGLCTDISEAPGAEACGDCTVYKTWHLADKVDQRFWY